MHWRATEPAGKRDCNLPDRDRVGHWAWDAILLAPAFDSETMEAHITLVDGTHMAVHDGLTFGRVAGNDVVLEDSKVSRRHARLVLEGGVAEIEDLGSSNGTMLNGRRIARRVLRDGDELRIGTSLVKFHEGPVPGAAAAPAPVDRPRPEPAAEPVAAEPVAPATPEPATAGSDAADDVDLFGDEDDLFDGAADEELPAPPPGVTRVALPPLEKPPEQAPPARQPEPVAPKKPQPTTPPPASPRASAPPPASDRMVEFADEVVELRSSSSSSASSSKVAPSADNTELQAQSRVLQFSNTAKPGGRLADDIGQMNAGARWLVYALAGAGMVGLVWGVMQFMR